MKLDEYKRSKSFFDHGQMLLRFQNFFFSFSKTVETFELKFHMKAYGNTRFKICANGLSHMAKMAAMPIYGKHLKNLLLLLQQYYQYYSNDGLGLISTFFTARLNMENART